ncbi:signal peptidase [Chryseobacterium gossypii]|uniref:signal peptidase n=1 Tax=Chryseobacterium gossypii TaxID=3231602 RepID=UPI003523CDC9
MKTINKLVFALSLLFTFLVNAQPPNPGGGSTGGHGTGGQASPIDMYVYVLGIIAVMFIVFFTKKYSGKKIS